jgi:alkylation response protein AidB-like acyl-CoA dehydrogenase
MELNEDQKTVQSWVHDFAENVMRPAAHEWDEREETPWPIIQEAANIGLYSMDFMADAFSDPMGLKMVIALEELAWGDAGITLALMGTTLAVAGIMANGTPEQAMEWVPQCFGTPDDLKLAAFGVSEPDAGSDVSSLKTRAVYDAATDEWVLNGTKTWITNGGIAHTHVIVASVEPELAGRGQASFVIPEGTKGISMGQKFQKMGIRASHTAEVVLDECRIPGRMLLGGKDKLDERLARAREGKKSGAQAAMKTFEATRPSVGAQALGIARAAYEYSLDYAKERTQFGRPIGSFQAIKHKCADMLLDVESSKSALYYAAWTAAQDNEELAQAASLAKSYCSEAYSRTAAENIQIHGGIGFTWEHPAHLYFKRAKSSELLFGDPTYHRELLAQRIGI